MEQTTDNRTFLTQSELADRWRVAQSSIKNWRERGHLCYFQLPGSSRVLYPLKAIEEIERKFTKPAKGVVSRKKTSEVMREKPVISTDYDENWRI